MLRWLYLKVISICMSHTALWAEQIYSSWNVINAWRTRVHFFHLNQRRKKNIFQNWFLSSKLSTDTDTCNRMIVFRQTFRIMKCFSIAQNPTTIQRVTMTLVGAFFHYYFFLLSVDLKWSIVLIVRRKIVISFQNDLISRNLSPYFFHYYPQIRTISKYLH